MKILTDRASATGSNYQLKNWLRDNGLSAVEVVPLAEPEIVLRGFVADVCGIMNWASSPRKDGYSSNGSDERSMAYEYYHRVGYPYWKG
ncbi:hypothetical protein FNU76_19335 [Chitinimonas arctica]|uniref:Uncharacterized protein n=1 Tax=Chitinimonas arctica TaxID=2594795 RepID=A0A516SJK3_9NEIS|nr:hypothetical protein [Chitinimonas arctica]QDQ28330.1 hypothetical protein FNU76_19335 [Chitinimonas arctica]